jgi:FkbM family methyltransferase
MSLADSMATFLFKHEWRGAVRFHQNFCHGRNLKFKTKHGVILELDPYEYIDRLVLKNGFYEEEVLNAVLQNMRPGEVFWDIGANLGLHALTISKLVPSAQVFAFEPNQTYTRKLAAAAVVNQSTVQVFGCALDRENGVAPFFVHQGNSGRSGMYDWKDSDSVRETEVVTKKGDTLVAEGQCPPPNVIKIDVEGNEVRVFQGFETTLENRRLRAIIFEDADDPATRLKLTLKGKGFEIHPLARLEPTQHNLENFAAIRA